MSDTRPALPRVLLVDDDLFMLELLQEMLSELGQFAIRTETDARRAMQALADERPDLLICDLSMPDMDGFELLSAAAAAAFRGHVLLLSGVDPGVRKTAERLARAQGLRIVGAYRKPISLEQMGAVLAGLGAPFAASDAPRPLTAG